MELEHGVSAGIRLRLMGSGLVPLYEEHEARLERGISLEGWMAMAEMEKALLIAARRISIQMKNLQTEEEIRKMPKAKKK